jgi:O-antigen/teichoic acid export membrane protein
MIRELAKKTGIYSIGMIFGRAVSVLLLPVYTRFLTPADYGVMELLDVTANLVSLLLGARLGQTIFYFYFAAKTQEEKERCVGTAFFCSILIGACCFAISFAGAPELSRLVFGTVQYGSYLRLVFLGFGLSLPAEIGYCCMRAFGDSKRFVVLNLLNQLGAGALALTFLVFFHWGIRALLAASVSGFAATAAYAGWYLLSPIRVSVDLRLMGRLVRYAAPLGISGMAVFLVHYGDRIFLRPQVSLTELGVYSLAYKIGMLVSFCHAPFVLHWNSQICNIGNRREGEAVFVRSFTYLCAGLSIVVVALSLFAGPGLRLMTTPGFYGAAGMIPWIAAAYLLRAAGAHIQSVFTLEGRPGLEARVNVMGGVACVAAYAVLVPQFKVWGAIAATILGFAVILVSSFLAARRLRRFHYEYRTLARIGASTLGALVAFFVIAPSSFWMQAGLGATLTLAHCGWLFFACLNQEQRASALRLTRDVHYRFISRRAVTQIPQAELRCT